MTAAASFATFCIARVAFNVRVYKTFDYVLPAQIDSAAAAKACIGCRVQAPFGSKQAVGVIVSLADASSLPTRKLKTISKIYDDMPALPASFLKMIQFCSGYYHCPIGIAMATALPAFFRRANEYHIPKKHAAGESLSTTMSTPNTPPPLVHPPLTDEQQSAINKLKLNDGFAPHLLFGKTGSGKTAVYLHAIHNRLAAGKQTLFLTPEIHLIPQLEQTLRAHFGSYRIAVLHSGVSDGERAHRWLAAARGDADIILGTRLAVFTPLPRLGLLVIDEEHDESYKQEDRLPFSAKNIAIWRAQNESLPYIAGSATPSLESYHLHAAQRCLRMNRRVSQTKTAAKKNNAEANQKAAARFGEAAARFHFIDDNPQTQFHGLQPTFINALKKHLEAKRQALIFINRRGYAPTLFCGNCQVAQQCSRCSVAMTVHKQRHCLMCHHCGHTQPLPTHCPQCEGALTARGSGTQRIEHALEKLFPQHPQCRLDRDALQPTSESFAAREADIVSNRTRIIIGTQIIAKGHNFPHLSFIGLLNTDRSLHAVDFRAEERAYAMLSQVVGRGMRYPAGCDVFIQTKHAAHPFYTALANDEVEPYWQQLLEERRRAGLPPFTHLALLRARAKSAAVVQRFMTKAIATARPLAQGQQGQQGDINIYDSVPPVIEKIGGYHHRHCLIRARNRRHLQAFLNNWRQQIPATAIHWSLDIDPTSV